MKIDLKKSVTNKQSTIAVTGSKSETNRLLLLKALYPNLKLQNISNSDDSDMMHNALSNSSRLKDIHHAGTAMRFLTAYFSIQEDQEVVLTGSSRMQERPIKILVEALKQLDVVISYEKNEGYPPIKIRGKRITKNEVVLKADVSSQYISALLLIAPKLENGLKLILEGKITSVPYINMTLALLNEIGVKTTFEKVQKEDKISSLNDRLNKIISFGLNDRIGFEKKLFAGSSDDFNRVISQLNTFDSFDEARSFVQDFVKPDYNNWEGNEEFEARFMEIVEKKFS